MDTEKAVDRILRIARRLTDEGYAFHWYFVGDGVLLREWTALRDQLAAVLDELRRIEAEQGVSDELLDTIRMITTIMKGMQEDFAYDR